MSETALNDDRPADFAPPRKSLRSRLLSSAFWIGFGRVASFGTLFLAQAVLARALTERDLEDYGSILAAVIAMSTLLGVGLPLVITRVVRQTLCGPRPEAVSGAVKYSGRLFLLSTLILGPAYLVAAPYLGRIPECGCLHSYAWWIVAWSILASGCLQSAHALLAMDEFRSAVLWGTRRGGAAPNAAFLLIVAAGYALDGKLSLEFVLACQIVLTGISVVAAWFKLQSVLATVPLRWGPQAEADAKAPPAWSTGWFFRESFPVLITQLVAIAIDELDVLWIAPMSRSPRQILDYRAAKNLVKIVTGPALVIGASLDPFIAELLQRDEPKKLQRFLRGAGAAIGLPALALFFVYVAFAPWVMRVCWGPDFVGGASMLRVMAVGVVAVMVCGFSGNLLYMAGRQRLLTVVSASMIALYAATAPWAIRSYGGIGAAVMYAALNLWQSFWLTTLAKRVSGIWTVMTFSPGEIRSIVRQLVSRQPPAETAAPLVVEV